MNLRLNDSIIKFPEIFSINFKIKLFKNGTERVYTDNRHT